MPLASKVEALHSTFQVSIIVGAAGQLGAQLTRQLAENARADIVTSLLLIDLKNEATHRLAHEVTGDTLEPFSAKVIATPLVADVTREESRSDIIEWVRNISGTVTVKELFWLPAFFYDPKSAGERGEATRSYMRNVMDLSCRELLHALYQAGLWSAQTRLGIVTSGIIYASDYITRTLLAPEYYDHKISLTRWLLSPEAAAFGANLTISVPMQLRNEERLEVPALNNSFRVTHRGGTQFGTLAVLGNAPTLASNGTPTKWITTALLLDMDAGQRISCALRWVDGLFLPWVVDVVPSGFTWYNFVVHQFLFATSPWMYLCLAPSVIIFALALFWPLAYPLMWLPQLPCLPELVRPEPFSKPYRPLRALVVNVALTYLWWHTTRWCLKLP